MIGIKEMEVDGFEFVLTTNGPFIESDDDADKLVEEINGMVQQPEKVVIKLWDKSYNNTYVGSLTMYKDIALELNLPAENGGIIRYNVTPFEHSALVSKVNEYTRIYELGMKAVTGDKQ